MKTLALAALTTVAALAIPAAASAQSYSIRGDYNNSVFQYGSGVGGASFTPYAASYAGGCFNNADFACKTDGGNSSVPAVGVNNSTGDITFAGTVTLPNNVLLLHPGFGAGTDSILRFTAPTAGIYDVGGIFSRLDNTNGGGDGVNVSIFANGVSLFNSSLANTPRGVSSSFGNLRVTLGANQFLDFVVNNGNGAPPEGTNYDSTGLSGTISAVPEPASWALMIGGFGLVGFAMRRRVRTTVRYA